MSAPGEPSAGIWSSLKRTLDGLLATVQTRIELFVVELEEEKCRVVEIIVCAAAVAAFGMMALTVATFAIVALFWENGRLIALGVLAALYLAATALAWRALQSRLRKPGAFSGTLGELKKDRSCLGPEN
jgi:uncharacterized membrane protein YqjE